MRRGSLRRSRSCKVTDFGANGPVCDLLTYIPSRIIFQLSGSIAQIIAFDKGCLLLMYSFSVTGRRLRARSCFTAYCQSIFTPSQRVLLLSLCASRLTELHAHHQHAEQSEQWSSHYTIRFRQDTHIYPATFGSGRISKI